MKYALFLGCVIPVKYPGFEKATREVLKALDVELLDLPFSCCPAPTQLKLVHSTVGWPWRPETSAWPKRPG